jgi:hypothetical protein
MVSGTGIAHELRGWELLLYEDRSILFIHCINMEGTVGRDDAGGGIGSNEILILTWR